MLRGGEEAEFYRPDRFACLLICRPPQVFSILPSVLQRTRLAQPRTHPIPGLQFLDVSVRLVSSCSATVSQSLGVPCCRVQGTDFGDAFATILPPDDGVPNSAPFLYVLSNPGYESH